MFNEGKWKGHGIVAIATKEQLINNFPQRSEDLTQNIVICGEPTNCTNINYQLFLELHKFKAYQSILSSWKDIHVFGWASVIYFYADNANLT